MQTSIVRVRNTVLADVKMRRHATSLVRVGATKTFKPLRPTPNIITPGDLHDYVNLLDPLIKSLNDDVSTNLVTDSPGDLEATAMNMETEAKDASSILAMTLRTKAALLQARAKEIRDLVARRGVNNEQASKEIAYTAEWRDFYSRWLMLSKKMLDISVFTSGGDWTQIQAYDVEYQGERDKYVGLGMSPSRDVPAAPPDTPTISGALGSIPWVPIVIVVGLVAAVFLFGSMPSRSAAVAA